MCGNVQVLIPRIGEGADFDTLSLYDERSEVVVVVSTMCEEVAIKQKKQEILYRVNNNGEQRLVIICEKGEYSLEPGEIIDL